MATILVKIKVFEGKEKAFETTARTMVDATQRHEPGCRRYEYYRGAERGSYYCLESFDSFLSFMKHQTSDHHEASDFDSMIEEVDLEWLDPIQGASELVPTEPQNIPDDADKLTKEYSKKYGVVMQEWWQKLR
jgi:quinol monooxygenase YgiN